LGLDWLKAVEVAVAAAVPVAVPVAALIQTATVCW